MSKTSWEWIQSFIAVAESGSLSKAALLLGTSQPTLSRHMQSLEHSTGLTLFNRSTKGLQLSVEGLSLLSSSKMMRDASEQFMRQASGQSKELTGTIRISVNEIIALYYLPEIIAEFNTLYPKVDVEIDVSNTTTSLNKRDADIALRMFKPTQPDLIIRRLPDIELKLVASDTFIQRYGIPSDLTSISRYPVIGFDRDTYNYGNAKSNIINLSDLHILNKTDFLPLHIELARKGAGITATHIKVIKQYPELQEILPEICIPNIEFWLVCHADVQHNRRIRVMTDFLYEKLNSLLIT